MKKLAAYLFLFALSCSIIKSQIVDLRVIDLKFYNTNNVEISVLECGHIYKSVSTILNTGDTIKYGDDYTICASPSSCWTLPGAGQGYPWSPGTTQVFAKGFTAPSQPDPSFKLCFQVVFAKNRFSIPFNQDSAFCKTIPVTCWVGTEEDEEKYSNIKVFPNPCVNELNITGLEKETDYRLMDQMGRMVKFGQLKRGNNQLDLSEVQKGLYFLTMEGNTSKIILE